jgi:hypothetical protein
MEWKIWRHIIEKRNKMNLEMGAGTFSGFGGILKLVQLPFLPGFINIGPAPSRKEKNEVE